MRKIFAAVLLVWSVSFSQTARAAPALADRIPADAIFYLGWAGTDALSKQYDTSHLKAIVDASDMGKLFTDFVPRLIRRVAKDDQDAADIIKQVVQVGAAMEAPGRHLFWWCGLDRPHACTKARASVRCGERCRKAF